MGFKNGLIRGKKGCYRKKCSVIDLIFTSRITFRFEISNRRLYVRFMHKHKVTKLGSLISVSRGNAHMVHMG